jgi:hypothetical protein
VWYVYIFWVCCNLLYKRGYLHLLRQIELNMFIYMHALMIIICHFIWCTTPVIIYTYASYTIAVGVGSSRARGAGRGSTAGRARTGGAGRRGGRWRASGVPWPPSQLFWERQAPEHISLGLQIFNLCFNYDWCIKFRSWLQPLLHYSLSTLVIISLIYRGKWSWVKCLTLLRQVEVGWFPVTYEF